MSDNKDEITIPEPYAIGRTPVTNAQFRYFMEDGGYSERWRRCWTADGWSDHKRNDTKAPYLFDNPAFNSLNQPVVGVTWYEAVAYANWLGEKTGGRIVCPRKRNGSARRGTPTVGLIPGAKRGGTESPIQRKREWDGRARWASSPATAARTASWIWAAM